MKRMKHHNQIAEKIFETLGSASMCWEFPERAGQFKDQRMVELGQELLSFIEERVKPNIHWGERIRKALWWKSGRCVEPKWNTNLRNFAIWAERRF